MSLTSYRAAPPRVIYFKTRFFYCLLSVLSIDIYRYIFFELLSIMPLADLAATYSPVP